MDLPADELLAWLALDAARVPGRARAAVRERGALRVLAEGGLVLGEPPVSLAWDARAAVELARRGLAFREGGGLFLGGPREDELGRAARRERTPLVLYGRGEAALLQRSRAVAIVGTREPSPVGLTRARRLAEALVEAEAVVVSGGAYGIDQEAHLAALGAGGETVAVLGQPVGEEDERREWMRDAFDTAGRRALSLTPFGPAVAVHRGLFAARNWTLAALADAVVVVEGTLDSGTGHTAKAATTLGIPIYAWASDVERAGAAMPNQLLAQGRAKPLPADAREAAARILGLPMPEPSGAPEPGRGRVPGPVEAGLPRDAGPRQAQADPDPPLVAALRAAGGRLLLDEAARALGLPAGALLAEVAELELCGAVRREGAAVLLCGA